MPSTHRDLSRRERQILDILFKTGRASAAEVQAALPDPPSYSAVRALLRILEEKGHVRHEQDGPRSGTFFKRFSMDPPSRRFPRCSTISPPGCQPPSSTGSPI